MNTPPHCLQQFRFTKENAREFAAKGWQARRERKTKLEAEAAKGRQATPQSERIARQIERLEGMMDKSKDANELQKLSAAHARLFNAWQVLTGTPNPGSRRAKSPKPAYVQVEPIAPQPTPTL
jgi:hypothetical protein